MMAAETKTAMTPTERRLWKLLSDGEPHAIGELISLFGDPFMEAPTVRNHISNLRRKMPSNTVLVSVFGPKRVAHYQVFRTLKRVPV